MSQSSSIEWTDATWNPVRGCVKISPGCKHCYAETFAERWRGIVGHPYEQGFDPRLVSGALDAPLHWKKPRTIFVNSMSDLFGDFVPNEYIAAVFAVMAASPVHTFQVLTKRASRLPKWFAWAQSHTVELCGVVSPPLHPYVVLDDCLDRERYDLEDTLLRASVRMKRAGHVGPLPWPLPNVHLGVSVEDCKYGLPRIEHLRSTPAAARFLSIEPLLEDLGAIDLAGIHWVIVGGESGVGAREMNIKWVRSIRDQCVVAGVPFFFKQWGGIRKKTRGRLLDGRTWDEMPPRTT